MNNNDNNNEVVQTLENAPRDFDALEWDDDLGRPVWAGRVAWQRDFADDLEEVLGDRYKDFNIRDLVQHLKKEMTFMGNYYLEPYPVEECEDYFYDEVERFNYGADWLRWLEQGDLGGRLEHEGLTVSEGWANSWHTDHSVRVLIEGEETTLDFHSLEIERDGERREVWAYDFGGDELEIFLSAEEAQESLEDNVGYEFLEPLGGYQG